MRNTGPCGGIGVEALERDRLVADFAGAVGTINHSLECMLDIMGAFAEVGDERDIDHHFFDLIGHIDRIGVFFTTSGGVGRRAFPFTSRRVLFAVHGEFLAQRYLLGLECLAQ